MKLSHSILLAGMLSLTSLSVFAAPKLTFTSLRLGNTVGEVACGFSLDIQKRIDVQEEMIRIDLELIEAEEKQREDLLSRGPGVEELIRDSDKAIASLKRSIERSMEAIIQIKKREPFAKMDGLIADFQVSFDAGDSRRASIRIIGREVPGVKTILSFKDTGFGTSGVITLSQPFVCQLIRDLGPERFDSSALTYDVIENVITIMGSEE